MDGMIRAGSLIPADDDRCGLGGQDFNVHQAIVDLDRERLVVLFCGSGVQFFCPGVDDHR